MKVMTDNFDSILEQCLSQIAAGKATIWNCLARFPEHAAELEPLWVAAIDLVERKAVVTQVARGQHRSWERWKRSTANQKRECDFIAETELSTKMDGLLYR